MVDSRCTKRYNEIIAKIQEKEKDLAVTEWEPTREKFNGHTIYHKFFDLTVSRNPGIASDLVLLTITNDDEIEFFEARGVWDDGYVGGSDLVQVGHGGIDNIDDGEEPGLERSQSSVMLTGRKKLIFRSWSGILRTNASVRIEASVTTVSGSMPEGA
jgi:hypothetical protein